MWRKLLDLIGFQTTPSEPTINLSLYPYPVEGEWLRSLIRYAIWLAKISDPRRTERLVDMVIATKINVAYHDFADDWPCMTPDDLECAVERIQASGNLTLTMFHAMQTVKASYGLKYQIAVMHSLRVYAQIKRIAPTLHRFNLGGGLPARNSDMDFQDWMFQTMRNIMDVCEEEDIPAPDLLIESGRFMVQDHAAKLFRVVKAKTIHTPQGLFDLNYFFSARPKDSDVSATVVKHRIKAFVLGLIFLVHSRQQSGHHLSGDLRGGELPLPEAVDSAEPHHVRADFGDGLFHRDGFVRL